ncbi:MAG: hypothetical protein O7C98_03070 [Planctomycetota bacterium]|nr:hypothetical protein [Planctomycetota bacterium]
MRRWWTRVLFGLCILGVASWFGDASARGQDWEIIEAPLVMPVASTGEKDTQNDRDPRYIINLTKHGEILYKGKQYSLAELANLLNRLKRLYGKFKEFGKPPNLIKVSELFVLLRVEKDAPWRHVQWLLAILEEQKFYKLQFGVKLKADRDYSAEEAALLGAERTDTRARPGRLEGKVLCFLGYPTAQARATHPRVTVEISGKDYKRAKRGPEGLEERVFPPQKAVYSVARRKTDKVRKLGGWIRDELANLPEKQSRLDVVGRIEAEADTPFKFVVAALNQLNEARVHRVEFGRAQVPDALRKRAYLPYPKLR